MRSWKAAYVREVHHREELEKELTSTRQVRGHRVERQGVYSAAIVSLTSAQISQSYSHSSAPQTLPHLEQGIPPQRAASWLKWFEEKYSGSDKSLLTCHPSLPLVQLFYCAIATTHPLQASKAQAENYRQEIRRLAALVLRAPPVSPVKTTGSRAAAEGDAVPASPGRRSTPPGRGKRPPGRSLTTAQDDVGPPSPHPQHVHRAAHSTLVARSEWGCDNAKPTRSSGWFTSSAEESILWRQQRLEVSAAAVKAEEGWGPERQPGQERDEKEGETVDNDMASREMDDGLAAARESHLRAVEEEGEESCPLPAAAYSPAANSGRSRTTKRAPGWGPSASAGRYSEAAGISRLRLALQGGNSAVFPQAASARLGLVRESPMACEWLDDNEENTGFEAVEASPAAPSGSHEGRTAEQESVSPTAAGSPCRKGSVCAGDPLHAESEVHPTDGTGGSKLNDDHSIMRNREFTSADGATAGQSRLSASLAGNRRSAVTWFEAPCSAPTSEARVAEEPPVFPSGESCLQIPGNTEGRSVSPLSGRSSASSSSSPTRSVGEGVAYKYRRRSDLGKQPSPTSTAFAAASGTNLPGGRGHRRSSSSPLPPLSPRLCPTTPSGDIGIDGGDDVVASCHSCRSSPASQLEACEEPLLGPTRSFSPCAPAAATQGVTAAVVVVRKANSAKPGSGSGIGAQRGNAAARRRGRPAQSGVYRDRSGGGHGEICAILGGATDGRKEYDRGKMAAATIAAATDDPPLGCSTSPGCAPADHFEDETNGNDKDSRVERAEKREARQRSDGDADFAGHVGGSTVDCGVEARIVGGPLSDRSISSDVSDDEGSDAKAERPSSSTDNARSSDLMLQDSSGSKPPANSSLAVPSPGSATPKPADRGISRSASNATLVEGSTVEDDDVLGRKAPLVQPKPRIIELYHSSPASSTSTSLSSSSDGSNTNNQDLPGGDDCPASDSDGEEEGSLEVSLGSSNGTADTFAEMQVSLGSLNLRWEACCRLSTMQLL